MKEKHEARLFFKFVVLQNMCAQCSQRRRGGESNVCSWKEAEEISAKANKYTYHDNASAHIVVYETKYKYIYNEARLYQQPISDEKWMALVGSGTFGGGRASGSG